MGPAYWSWYFHTPEASHPFYGTYANSADPDQMPQYVASNQDLLYLFIICSYHNCVFINVLKCLQKKSENVICLSHLLHIFANIIDLCIMCLD